MYPITITAQVISEESVKLQQALLAAHQHARGLQQEVRALQARLEARNADAAAAAAAAEVAADQSRREEVRAERCCMGRANSPPILSARDLTRL